MIRERVAEDLYLFTSEIYAKVNAAAVVGPDWTLLIDTLGYPQDTREMRNFITDELDSSVRFIINTHHHTDHTLGNQWFPDSIILCHSLCRQLLDTAARDALGRAKEVNRELENIHIVLPNVIFEDGSLSVRVGKRTLQLIPLPGHSVDGTGVLLMEEKILFSGDIMMPIPYVVDGDFDVMIDTLNFIPKLKLENLVQGHGDVILRGEIPTIVKDNIKYLKTIKRHAKKALRRKDPSGFLSEIDVESCGKSRILMNGLAEELHQRNLAALYNRMKAEREQKKKE